MVESSWFGDSYSAFLIGMLFFGSSSVLFVVAIALLKKKYTDDIGPTVVSLKISDDDEKLCIKNDFYALSNFTFLGLDCEMVGVGRGGNLNSLARCSIVTIRDGEIKVVYDKIVKPKRRQQITDYRTKYSGITKEMIESSSSIPFKQCKNEVADILSSYDGKKCVVVGHALKNDWNVLGIRHPKHLVRDTACYREFVHSGRRAQKLRHLVYEHLDLSIQGSASGHCSVEDAASVLLLYKKFQCRWEESLRHPLKRYDLIEDRRVEKMKRKTTIRRDPLEFYIDTSNLPIGLRGYQNEYEGQPWQIISKNVSRVGNSTLLEHYDWIPAFRGLIATPIPNVSKVVVMFDGAKYAENKILRPGTIRSIDEDITLEITENGEESDTRLVKKCSSMSLSQHKSWRPRIISIDEVINLLEETAVDIIDDRTGVIDESKSDELDYYIVVRRIGGGKRAQRNLFSKYNLIRPNEGAVCLCGFTAKLLRRSLQIAKDIKRAGASGLLQFEQKHRNELNMAVFTNDVLLADRIVKEGGVVLSYWQMQDLKI